MLPRNPHPSEKRKARRLAAASRLAHVVSFEDGREGVYAVESAIRVALSSGVAVETVCELTGMDRIRVLAYK